MFLWEKCKGLRGLKAHQRSCRVVNGLTAELLEDLEKDENNCCTLNTISGTLNSTENQCYLEDEPDLKQGIKLPTSLREWEMANNFFNCTFFESANGERELRFNNQNQE